MALPIMTSEEDVNTIVEYLKTKATGASIEEAKAVIDKKYLDPRKITDYLAWGIVRKDGEKLKLDNLGREMAQKKEPTDISYLA